MVVFQTTKSQCNLLNNGSLDDFEIIDITNNSIFGTNLNISFWDNNICQQYYNPYLSKNSSSYIRITPYDRIGPKDYRIDNAVGQLCKNLLPDKKYQISFYVKPITGNAFYGGICAWFSALNYETNYFEVKHKHNNWQPTVMKCMCDDKIYTNTDSFYLVSLQYNGSGNEKFLFIGNPTGKKPLVWKNTDDYGFYKSNFTYSEFAHLAISKIAVTPLDENERCCELNALNNIDTLKHGQDTIIIPVYFANNSDSLTDKTKLYIKEHLSKINITQIGSIKILGYADTTGSISYNYKLASRRAKNVEEVVLGILSSNKMIVNIDVIGETSHSKMLGMNRVTYIYLFLTNID